MSLRPSTTEAQINDLSAVIGELRSFASQQSVTNTHMLDQLKVIAERMTGFSEVGAGLNEYRKTLHERFNRIHEQMSEIDERCDKLEAKVDALANIITMWKGQIKTLIVLFGVGGTIISSLLSTYGAMVLKAIASHTP